MEQYRHRRGAWIIGIIDLVLAILNVLGVIGMTASGAAVISIAYLEAGGPTIFANEVFTDSGAVFGVILALNAVQAFLQFYHAVKLVNGAQPGEDAAFALKQCYYWRRMSFVFLALNVIGLLGSFATPIWPVFLVLITPNIIFRSVGVNTVGNLMTELHAVPKTTFIRQGNGGGYRPSTPQASFTASNSDPPPYPYDC